MADLACLELQLALNTVEGIELMRALDDRPLTLADVGKRTNVDFLRLARVTRTLMGYGVLVRQPTGEYARSDFSDREAVGH